MPQGKNPNQTKTRVSGQRSWPSRLQQVRQSARENLPDGAVTPAYRANRDQIIDTLNHALSAEWISFLQYWHHYFMASDIHGTAVREIWKEHAEQEYAHALKINERINQLGGVPANAPTEIARLNTTPFEAGHDLCSMVEADLVAEREVIQLYNDLIRTCGFDDNETRTLIEGILLDETEHANELSNVLFEFDASTGERISSLHGEVVRQEQQRQQRPQLRRAAS